MEFRSWVAIGDSFTEGYGDEQANGWPRGWADLVAAQASRERGGEFRYANLAIRGRKMGAILTEQLDAAIRMEPEVISINGGGNDIMRPRMSAERLSVLLLVAARQIQNAGITPIIISGANPSRVMPLGRVMQQRGDRLSHLVRRWASAYGLAYVDNWANDTLLSPDHWTEDRLHLNARGHGVVAAGVAHAFGIAPDPAWQSLESMTTADGPMDARYWREFVAPWVGRRLTGRSSGDRRKPKYDQFVVVRT